MLNFDWGKYAYASRRNVVFARKGMACSCVPLASQVGIDTMKRGGNAMDAAIAMAVTLPLVEPTCNGLGSDCFALIWSAKDKKLYGLNGSGVAPMALSAQRVREMGYEQMPVNGWLPTMVPGAPAAWAALRRRFGRLSMAELMAPAIQYAREGFPVSLNVHRLWVGEAERFKAAAEKEPAVFAPWLAYFTKDGEAYGPGELFRLPDYADTLESLAATDCESYYRGELMKKIVAFSRQTGGYFTEEDFINYAPLWVEPITINYKGYDVFEIPPNGHGITALMALNILKGMELGPRDSADTYHKMIEAMKQEAGKIGLVFGKIAVFDIGKRRCDFCGYAIDENGVKVRKSTRLHFSQKMRALQRRVDAGGKVKERDRSSICSYLGLMQHARESQYIHQQNRMYHEVIKRINRHASRRRRKVRKASTA